MTDEQTAESEEEVNTNIIYYILFVILGICYYGTFHGLPNESTDIGAPAIIDSCGGLAEMNNNVKGPGQSLCDPNDLIDGQDKLDIILCRR